MDFEDKKMLLDNAKEAMEWIMGLEKWPEIFAPLEPLFVEFYLRKSREILEKKSILGHDNFLKVESNTTVRDFFGQMYKFLEEAGLDLSAIDTSEADLEKIIKNQLLHDAKWYLSQARKNEFGADNEIDVIFLRYLVDSRVTYQELETTYGELVEIKRQSHKKWANHYLNNFRKGSNNNQEDIGSLLKNLQEAGLKPEDIGTTAKELSVFIKSEKDLRIFCLHLLREKFETDNSQENL